MWYAQEDVMTCVPAALRSVLSEQYCVTVPEAALEGFGTEPDVPIRKHGTGPRELRRMLREANRAYNAGPRWRMITRRRGRIADLRTWRARGSFPLVSVTYALGADGVWDYHVVIVRNVGKYFVTYFDPYDGKHHSSSIRKFRQWWRDEDGETWFAAVYVR